MLVPKLRFKEFKNEWKKIKLKNISTELQYGMNVAATDFDGMNKYIRITDIDDNTHLYINNPVSPDGKLEGKFLVNINDILFARTGASTGKAYLYSIEDGRLYFAGFLIRAHIKENNNSRFIFEQTNLSRYNNWVKLTSMRSGQPGINSVEYGNYEFSVTNIDEENKIARFLELLNKKIKLYQKKIEVLKMYKKGLMQKIFAHSEINNWNTNILRNILTPGSKVAVTDTSKYQKITIKLNLQGITKSNVNREMADTRPFYIRRENEIIIGKQNYFNGSIAILPKEFDGCICSNAIMSFSVNSNYLTKFVYYYISQNNYIKRREYFANGTGQKELSENDFLNFQIKAPSIETQKHITNILDSIDSKIDSNVNIYTSLTILKKSLLQQMFI